jgi:polyferredoxin
MNPLKWRREHQLALVLGAVLGIGLGFVAGYSYHGIHFEKGLSLYITGGSAFRWGIFGALVGGTTIYIRQLLHA